ncbi:MAG TPA: hypothetical protein VFS34_13340 [Thermoanaerobaculia bacterium]|nr:hypothetical protein [Thermoanaerobaculia bacterium]
MILIVGAAYLFLLIPLLRHERARTLSAMGLSIVACGVLYWPVPYSTMKILEGIFPLLWVGDAVIGGLAITRWTPLPWPKIAGVAGLGFVTSVMARVIFDTFRDPESHNLFFLEVAMAFVVGFVGASIAAAMSGSAQARRP